MLGGFLVKQGTNKLVSILLALAMLMGLLSALGINALAEESNYKILIWMTPAAEAEQWHNYVNPNNPIDGFVGKIVDYYSHMNDETYGLDYDAVVNFKEYGGKSYKVGTALEAADLEGVDMVIVIGHIGTKDNYSSNDLATQDNADLLRGFADKGGRVVLWAEHPGFNGAGNNMLSNLAELMGGGFSINNSAYDVEGAEGVGLAQLNADSALSEGLVSDWSGPFFYIDASADIAQVEGAPAITVVAAAPLCIYDKTTWQIIEKDSTRPINCVVDQPVGNGNITVVSDIDCIKYSHFDDAGDPSEWDAQQELNRKGIKQFLYNLLYTSAMNMAAQAGQGGQQGEQGGQGGQQDEAHHKVLLWNPANSEFARDHINTIKYHYEHIDDMDVTVIVKNDAMLTADELEGIELVYIMPNETYTNESVGQSVIAAADLLKEFAILGGRVVMNGEVNWWNDNGNAVLNALSTAMGGNFTITDTDSDENNMTLNPEGKPALAQDLDVQYFNPVAYANITSTNETAVWFAKDSSGNVFVLDQIVEKGFLTVLADRDWLMSDYIEIGDLDITDYSNPRNVANKISFATDSFGTYAITYKDAVKSPQTGDNSHMGLWIMLMMLSSGGIAATVLSGRKKRTLAK